MQFAEAGRQQALQRHLHQFLAAIAKAGRGLSLAATMIPASSTTIKASGERARSWSRPVALMCKGAEAGETIASSCAGSGISLFSFPAVLAAGGKSSPEHASHLNN